MYNEVISIHGVPRSGTTWLGQIINSNEDIIYKYQPLFSYAFKDAIGVRSNKEEILDFYTRLYYYSDDFLDQKEAISKGYSPRFEVKYNNPTKLATKMVRYHYMIPSLLEKIDNIKIIAIIRNPFSVLSSWKSAPREFYDVWNFKEEWRYAQSKNNFKPEEYFGFEKWKEFVFLVNLMKEKYPNKVFIVRYEDLVNETEKNVKKIFNFCNLELSNQTLDFINKSKNINIEDTYSVFRGKVDLDKWKKEICPEIIDEIYNELKGTMFENYLY